MGVPKLIKRFKTHNMELVPKDYFNTLLKIIEVYHRGYKYVKSSQYQHMIERTRKQVEKLAKEIE